MNAANICIVLVEPQGALNIGSVCRVMMNFGFTDLRLVNPTANHLSDEARRMAVKASHLLENAKIFPHLAAALSDCQLALGTTRRFGKYREEFFSPDEAGRFIHSQPKKTKTAYVFGREDSGLFTSELDLCQRLITIPTDDQQPSMNLAQAVTVCLYEFTKHNSAKHKDVRVTQSSVSGKDLENMFQHMRQSLLDIGYLDPQNPDHILRAFRRMFGRAGLNEREVRILQGLWNRIDWTTKQLKKINTQ